MVHRNDGSFDESTLYDCVECGHKESVSVKGSIGSCKTPGCLCSDPIQYVFFPTWPKPKASRAGREIYWKK